MKKTKPDTPRKNSWASRVNNPEFLSGIIPKNNSVVVSSGLSMKDAHPEFYLKQRVEALTDADQELLVKVLRFFGTGQHPYPSVQNLTLFGRSYVLQCIDKALADASIMPRQDLQTLKEKLDFQSYIV